MDTLENNPEEIDLIELLKTLWKSKKLIAKITSFFVILGILVSLLSPISYTASSSFIPQSGQAGSGSSNLSGVVSLVGINLGGALSGSEIPPAIYPQILESVPYKRELLAVSLKSSEKDLDITLKEHLLNGGSSPNILSLIKKYTIMLPFTVLSAIRGDKEAGSSGLFSEMSVSADEEDLFKALEDILFLSVNAKDGFVNLSAKMGDPIICALVAKEAQKILQ